MGARAAPVQAKIKRPLFSLIPKMHHNFSWVYKGSPDLGGSRTNVYKGLSMANSVDVTKIRKFLTCAAASPKRQFFVILRRAYTANQWYRWKGYTSKVRLWGSQPTINYIRKLPKTHEKRWVPEIYFIHPIRRRKIRGIQRYDYLHTQNQNKTGTYRQKNLTTFLMKLFGSYPADDARLSRTDARRQYSPLVIFFTTCRY